MSTKKAISGCTGDSIERFIQVCLQLNDAMGDGTVSAVLSPMLIAAEEKCDVHAMEVAYSGDDRSEGLVTGYGEELVLCTTGLGLLRVERKEDGEKEESVLMKAKVAVWSVLETFSDAT